MTHNELAAMGELYVARQLSATGLGVTMGGPADLLVEDVAVEVKAARPAPYRTGGYTGYQFCLHRQGRNGLRAKVVVLLCYWDEGSDPVAFIIPARRLGKRRKVAIPGDPWTYSGRWSRWYRRWETIADIMKEVTQ
jgi:hypothetical protein